MTATDNNIELESSKSNVLQLEIDAFPFKGLKITEDWRKLESLEGRTLCSICNKSRKYFCYTCHVPVNEIQKFVPKLKLPVKIDIIKHPREMDGKSTAVHAAVLAPRDVRVFTYPCIPDYEPDENVVLIFPNKDAVSVEEVCERLFRRVSEPVSKRQCREDRYSVIHRAVFIDSTWNQSRGIFKDPRLKALPSVVLRSRLSQFWRHQADSPRWYLATIEAIHQFLLEQDEVQWRLNHRIAENSHAHALQDKTGDGTCYENKNYNQSSLNSINKGGDISIKTDEITADTGMGCGEEKYTYDGQYDNLLFFFRFMYNKIHTLYEHEQLRSYKRRLE